MKLAIQLCMACLFSCALLAHAQTKKVDVDVNLLLKNYSDTWAIKDSAERLTKLKAIWVLEGTHESPMGLSDGIDAISKEIEGLLRAYPNAKVSITNIQRTGNSIVGNFTVHNADGSVLFRGLDYFELAENGLLKKTVGFIQ